MRNIMHFKGVSNIDMGVVLTSKPTIATPQERGEELEIPGRNGTLWRGEGVYMPIEINVTVCVLPGSDLSAVRTWLIGEGALAFDNDAAYWDARVSGDVHFAPRDFDGGYDTTITFTAQPFRRVNSVDVTIISNPQSINNPYAIYSEPLITVECYGSFALVVNQTIINFTGVTGIVHIDSELQEVYTGNVLINSSMTGAFPVLQPGMNTISYSGSITAINIEPRWRTV